MGDSEIITGTLPGPGRLDKLLAEASGLSRERVKTLMGDGAVTVSDIFYLINFFFGGGPPPAWIGRIP